MNVTTNKSIQLLMLIAFTFMSITASNVSMSDICDMSDYSVVDKSMVDNFPCHDKNIQGKAGNKNCCDNSQCACISIQQITVYSGLNLHTSNWLIDTLYTYMAHQFPEIYIPSKHRPPIA